MKLSHHLRAGKQFYMNKLNPHMTSSRYITSLHILCDQDNALFCGCTVKTTTDFIFSSCPCVLPKEKKKLFSVVIIARDPVNWLVLNRAEDTL